MTNNTDDIEVNEHLLPDRHPQADLFVCDVADAVLKDVMAHMEHPFYSLSKKPDTKIRRYEHKGNWLEITPSVKGLATIYDKDILIYCVSQIMAKLAEGQPIGRRVRISTRELLIFTNRGTAGKDYQALVDALDRLAGTKISTNIRVNEEEEEYTVFSLIDSATIRRKHGFDGRLLWCDVSISDWVFDAIRQKEVLTLHRDYFRLRKPIERRVYEIARKHCGMQSQWKIGLPLLLKKTGSASPLKKFRFNIRDLAKSNHLPDYNVEYMPEDDSVLFTLRAKPAQINTTKKKAAVGTSQPTRVISASAMEAIAGKTNGWDKYYLKDKYMAWKNDTGDWPENIDAAFIGWVRIFVKDNPAP